MALSRSEQQITWSAANSKSVAAGATENADDYAPNAAAYDLLVTVKADNAGTAASGDAVDIYAFYKNDPDGDATAEYDNAGGYLGTLDTYSEGSGGTVKKSFGCVPAGSIRFVAVSKTASNGITVSIVVTEMRA